MDDDDVDDRHSDPGRRRSGGSRARRGGARRRCGRALPAAPAARAGPAGAGLRRCLRRRRDLVLEPLPGQPGSTARATSTSTCSPRSSTRTGAGARSSPASRRSSAGCTTSPTPSTCAATSSSRPRSPARTSTRTAAAGGSPPTAARPSTRSSSSPARACSPRRWRTSSRARTASAGRSSTPRAGRRSRSSWPASGSAWSAIGATGIQVIQTIAAEVGHLTVFARTPQYVLPMKNPKYVRVRPGLVQVALRGAARHHPAHLHRLRVRLRARLGRLHPDSAARRSSRRSTRTGR